MIKMWNFLPPCSHFFDFNKPPPSNVQNFTLTPSPFHNSKNIPLKISDIPMLSKLSDRLQN